MTKATAPFDNGLDPDTLSGAKPHQLSNLVGGQWTGAANSFGVVDPLNGEPFILVWRGGEGEKVVLLLIAPCPRCPAPLWPS